jgi:hypothetical protein
MEITDTRLREVIHNLLEDKTQQEVLEYIAIAEWDSELKERAFKMVNGLPEEEIAMAENGDISDMGIF